MQKTYLSPTIIGYFRFKNSRKSLNFTEIIVSGAVKLVFGTV